MKVMPHPTKMSMNLLTAIKNSKIASIPPDQRLLQATIERAVLSFLEENLHTLLDGIREDAKNQLKILIEQGLRGKDGEPGNGAPTLKEIVDVITPLIPPAIPGTPGKNADEEKIVKRVLKLIPKNLGIKDIEVIVRSQVSTLLLGKEVPTKADIKKIAESVILTPDEVVEKINKADAKIKPEQVEGLKEAIRRVGAKQDGGGGGMGNWQHEVFSISSATTTVTLARNVAAGGSAILVRYQGQLLAHGVQYTISGKVITLAFTPDDSTFLEVTYVRS